jgi:hypothetical protein
MFVFSKTTLSLAGGLKAPFFCGIKNGKQFLQGVNLKCPKFYRD